MSDTLFPLDDVPAPEPGCAAPSPPRLLRPNRQQLELRPADLDGLLPAHHRARLVWQFVESLDLQAFHARVRAVEGHAGRPAIDPAILLALWLYATLHGVGSARALARLCEEHDAYRWLCGGVSVNYHTLADFRVGPDDLLDELLTQSVAALVATGAVRLHRVAQDGVKVRANAGRGSFRREVRLARLRAEASAQVEALKREVHDDPAATTRRLEAARARAARERQQRVTEALAQLPAVTARRQKAGLKGPARVSTTDPEARRMTMADGGVRPAFNGQFMTATDSQVIVGVALTNAGTDLGQLRPMVEQLQRRYHQRPAEVLADGGYVALGEIRALAALGCRVYAPPKESRGHPRARDARRRNDEATTEWRTRMATEAAQTIYKERAASSECVNAAARNRGLQRLLVRGVRKGRAILLWFALAHNLLRAAALRPAAVLLG
jgi:transposase